MKEPEVALTEWAAGEVKFDFGRGLKKFSAESFTFICEYIVGSTIGTVEHFISVVDTVGETWRVPFSTFINFDEIGKIRAVLIKTKKMHEFVPRLAMQFHFLHEVIGWAEGRIESKIQVQQIPPVDNWMKPL